MRSDSNYKIIKGPNLKVLDVNGFDRMVFGCPPSIVKYFKQRKEKLPAKYILPGRAFMKGRNNFDFEFIVYSFLFVRARKEKISIYCAKDQRHRFRIILGETLFGPTFNHLLKAQFHSFEVKRNFSQKESEKFQSFLISLATKKIIMELVLENLESLTPENSIIKILTEYFTLSLAKNKWLVGDNISAIASLFAKNYFLCFQMKREIEIFRLANENERDAFLNELIDFHIFDKNGIISIEGNQDKRHKLKIMQSQPAKFEIYQKNELKCLVDMTQLGLPPKTKRIELIEKPFVGATFIGVGSGFTYKRRNSCTLIWMEGKGILVDAFSDHNEVLLEYGITEREIEFMVLTHVHSDHDSGFIEKVLSGQRFKVLSTRIIYESFLRKLSAIICFPEEVLEGFIEFIELVPNKKTKLPGFKNSWIKFGYTLHSIPAGKMTFSYIDENGKETSISHSGDTKYDVEMINTWHAQGFYTKKRRDNLLGFIWDADLIIHEVGGGKVHTEFSELTCLDDSLTKKMALVHQHRDPVKHPKFCFAHEGQTKTLIKRKTTKPKYGVDSIKDIILFKNLSIDQLQSIIDQSRVVKLKAGEIVFSQNEVGDSFYILLDGFASIIIDGKTLALYEKGMFFGELAVSTSIPLRRATVRTMTKSALLKIPNKFYREFGLPEIQEEFYKLGNFFHDIIGTRLKNIISPELVASLGFGKMVHWNKQETIFPNSGDGKEIYIILSGEAAIKNSKGKSLNFLSEGDILGKLSNMKNVPKFSSAIVNTDKLFAVRLEVKQVKRMFKLFPSFYGTVYQKLKR